MKKQEIKKASAMQLVCRLSRLQFDEEAKSAMPGDVEEILLLKKELKKILIKLLGRDFYPPGKEMYEKIQSYKQTNS